MLRARYRRIILFFARVTLNIIFWELFLARVGFSRWSSRTRPKRYRHFAIQFRTLAISMGGVLIKVGQFLSSRVDVLPGEVTSELAGLQDEVSPEKFEDIRGVAEAEFGIPLNEKYDEFNPNPLAAASLGQVHEAKLLIHDKPTNDSGIFNQNELQGSDKYYHVVVKVQRPDIDRIIATDLAALRTVGGWIRHYPPIRRRADVPGLIAEFTRTLYEEIDYLAEGRNAETFAANFNNTPGIVVPKVVWTHTTKKVLTLEDVRGIKITDYELITTAGIDRAEVASRLLDTYLKQIFEDGFFHADPHPGNLFVKPQSNFDNQQSTRQEWLLTFIDFGMVGRMKAELRTGLRELIIGIGTRDPTRVIKAYQMLGVLLPGADLTLIEKAESEIFNRFWGKSMSELTQIKFEEMHEFAHEFRDLLYDMPFQIPQDIIFLGRAVGILSGMCTGLDPNFNVFEHLAPYSRKLIAEESKTDWSFWLNEVGDIVRKLFMLPNRTDAILSKIEKGDLIVRDPQLSVEVKKLERSLVKLTGVIIFVAFLIISLQLFLTNFIVPGWFFAVVSGVVLVWTMVKK
jgi:predicted unusual protein kinase regulating ubiquinone biosynthesis (AarF/ABC1/UbiB family)